MFKLFFMVTLFSIVVLWYYHQYQLEKFIQVFQKIPYADVITSQVHFYMSSSSTRSISPDGTNTKIFTSDELEKYNGESDGNAIYLAILGEVYDVTKGHRHYGAGGPYHVFAGRDASRSFVTGDFDLANPVDHVLDLSHSELLSLRGWLNFYKNEYEYKGKLVGRFYDEAGRQTEYCKQLQKKFDEAEKNRKEEKTEELLFPPCNVEWNSNTGTKVWCTNKSGGINRSWIGVPRKLYMVGSETYRCACVDLSQIENKDSSQYARRGHLQLYDNCDPLNTVCYVKE